MSKQCKMEFYFKRADLEKLLEECPDAKGIIIKQQITPRKTEAGYLNVTTISAYAAKPRGKDIDCADEEEIFGCPNPPGCD